MKNELPALQDPTATQTAVPLRSFHTVYQSKGSKSSFEENEGGSCPRRTALPWRPLSLSLRSALSTPETCPVPAPSPAPSPGAFARARGFRLGVQTPFRSPALLPSRLCRALAIPSTPLLTAVCSGGVRFSVFRMLRVLFPPGSDCHDGESAEHSSDPRAPRDGIPLPPPQTRAAF